MNQTMETPMHHRRCRCKTTVRMSTILPLTHMNLEEQMTLYRQISEKAIRQAKILTVEPLHEALMDIRWTQSVSKTASFCT